MIKMNKLIFSILLCIPFTLQAQDDPVVSGDHPELLTGEIYQPRHFQVKGHPFFQGEAFMNCTLYYQNKIYRDIRANIDLQKQAFVYYQEEEPSLTRYIKLNPGYIDHFMLEDLMGAQRLFQSNILHPLLPDRFKYYEVAFRDDSLTYLIARDKELIELPLHSMDRRDEFAERIKHFIFDGQQSHEIKNRRDILQLFADQKKEIRRFSRKQDIPYSLDDPDDIISIMKHYHTLQTHR
jgi:hypothetical protein